MRKQTLSLLIAFALMTTGCGNVTEPAVVKEPAPVESQVEEISEIVASEPTEIEEVSEPAEEVTTIEEQVIFDQDGIKITATGIAEDPFWGYELKMLVENDTDKTITVQSRNVSVNNYMLDPTMSIEVAPGKKANDEMSFSLSSFEKCGIEKITDIEFILHIFDAESWETIIDSDIIQITTSNAATYTQTYNDSGIVLYDVDGIKIVQQELVYDEFWGYAVYFYVENNTDQSITIQSRDTSINGFMVNPTMSIDVAAGKKAVNDMSFLQSEISENGIESIDVIETIFHIFNTDSWESIIDTDPITMAFE